MPQLLLLTWLSLAAMPQPATHLPRAERVIQLRVDPATRAQAELQKDGVTIALRLQPAPSDLPSQLLHLQAKNVVSVALPNHGALVYIVNSTPLEHAALTRHGNDIALGLKGMTAAQALHLRLLHPLPPPPVRGPSADAFTAAEAALKAGRIAAAKQQYTALAHDQAQQSRARLRLADVALFEGNATEACRLYALVGDAFDGRVVALLAQLRAAVACPDVPHDLDWPTLLGRERHDDATGLFVHDEALWALSWLANAQDIAEALGVNIDVAPDTQHLLLTRGLRWAESPFAVARLYLAHGTTLVRHADDADLRLWSAQALCSLDLQTQAAAALGTANKNAWHPAGVDAAAGAAVWQAAARCMGRVNEKPADVAYTDPIELRLQALEARVAQLRRVAMAAPVNHAEVKP